MTKDRKTTFEERVEIVQYCIAHDCNYAKTAEKYQVSYQQVRSYTLKYQKKGVEGLQDRLGRRKPESTIQRSIPLPGKLPFPGICAADVR